jgi:two-component system sensor histidine kinase DctS
MRILGLAIPSPFSPSGAAGSRWPWLLPGLALALFVASVGAQLWLSRRGDSEEERATLISDMLWMEQNLSFSLRHNEERLAQIGPQQAADPRRFAAHVGPLLDGGLQQVLFVSRQGQVLHAQPSGEARLLDASWRLATSLQRPVYSPAYRGSDGEWRLQVHVPVFQAGQPSGVAVGVYSLLGLLKNAAPWWLVQRNQIGILDNAGQSLASPSRLAGHETGPGHRIQLDPPGNGLMLWAAPIRTPTSLAGRILPVSLVLLAVLVLWSLWALRRHIQGRLLAESALREEHAFRKAMEDSLSTGLRARDMDGHIVYVNPAFCRMVGYEAEELVGHAPPMPYWDPEHIEVNERQAASVMAGEAPQAFESRLRHKDGHTVTTQVHAAPLIDGQGQQIGWLSSVVDVTEARRLQEHARQQEEKLQSTARLIAMGEMASSLAHELNQPLAAISSYTTGCLNLLDAGQAPPEALREAIAKAQAQAQRAGSIIRRIHDFVRRAEPKREPCDLEALIGQTLALLEVDARHREVHLELQLQPGLPAVMGDRVLLGQALFNLMRNGIEAMAESPGARLLHIAAAADAQVVSIRIADRGPGIPADIAARLFEPFFTTKAEGMGMGLNICRSIVEAHHGRLEVEANPDGGSVFVMRLPLAEAAP